MSNIGINPSFAAVSSVNTNKQAEDSQSLKRSVIQNYPHDKFSSMTRYPIVQIFFFQTLAMIIFVYGLCSIRHPGQADILIVLSIFLCVATSVYLSGANINPTITLCQCLRKQNKYLWKMFGIYFAAQIYGACIGLGLGELLNNTKLPAFFPIEETFMGCFRVVLSEMIGTFILIFFILLISNPNTTFIDDELYGYIFIAVFIHIGRSFAPSSGNCINFVIALLVDIIAATKGQISGIQYLPLWAVGQLLGCLLATFFYEKLFEPNVQQLRKKRRQSQNSEYNRIFQDSNLDSGSFIRMKQEQLFQRQYDSKDHQVEQQDNQKQE